MGLGNVHLGLGRYADAKVAYELARATFARLGLDPESAQCDYNLGAINLSLGAWRRRGLRSSVLVRHSRGWARPSRSAECDFNLGSVQLNLGLYVAAQAAYVGARTTFAELGQHRDMADCDLGLGRVHEVLGKYVEAEAAYEGARATYTGLG